jgi:hypothetical protein
MSVDQRTAALKKVYWLERDAIGLAMVSDADTSTDYISVNEVKTVTIHAVKLDEDFVASGTGITMTESPTLQAAQYFNNEWEMCIREGKKYANKGRDGSGYHIRQYDY